MNDIKKAIETLSDLDKCVRAKADGAYATNEFDEAAQIAISALEKQIPKKPINKTTGHDEHNERYYAECPGCGGNITTYTFHNKTHCWMCGQAIDWRNEDE